MWQKFKNLNPPVKWLLAFIAILLGFSFLFAPRPQPVDWSKVNFGTTSSSVLYFKNVRSYYYHIFEREKAPFVLYRLKRSSRDSTKPELHFMIIENRSANEAYIYAEQSTALEKKDSVKLLLPAGENYQEEAIPLKHLNNEGHFKLAAKVYARLLNNEQIYLLSRKDTVRSLYADKRKRIDTETVLEDYFKLVNKN